MKIKSFIRYQNRKIYSREESKYKNIPDILPLLKNGYYISVINKHDKQDVTTVIYLRLLTMLVEEKKVDVPIKLIIKLIKGEPIGEGTDWYSDNEIIIDNKSKRYKSKKKSKFKDQIRLGDSENDFDLPIGVTRERE